MKTNYEQLKKAIQNIHEDAFEDIALQVFNYQKQNNPLYQEFINLLGLSSKNIQNLEDIPFLPIQFFKSHSIKTGHWKAVTTFSSSGTTQTIQSKHYLKNKDWYIRNSCNAFEAQYGPLKDYIVLALLPSYLEREGSSLIYMVDAFIQKTNHPLSGFFLYNTQKLSEVLSLAAKENRSILLIGVSYALLDYIQEYKLEIPDLLVMETGGMKGKRKEMTKEQLHNQLKNGFGIRNIHSEYGMTELLSQAYSTQNGVFSPSATMHVCIREINDPMCIQSDGKIGAVNVVDLLNLDTCSFIATDDLGRRYANGQFSLHGRLDASDLRGCNLLLAEIQD